MATEAVAPAVVEPAADALAVADAATAAPRVVSRLTAAGGVRR
jgi:hypothetical protein